MEYHSIHTKSFNSKSHWSSSSSSVLFRWEIYSTMVTNKIHWISGWEMVFEKHFLVDQLYRYKSQNPLDHFWEDWIQRRSYWKMNGNRSIVIDWIRMNRFHWRFSMRIANVFSKMNEMYHWISSCLDRIYKFEQHENTYSKLFNHRNHSHRSSRLTIPQERCSSEISRKNV